MATRAPKSFLATITEKDFQKGVVHLAKMLGYVHYHSWLSARSAPGWPDLVLVRPAGGRLGGRTIYVECKRVGKVPTPPQQAWLDVLAAAGNEVYCWRPGDPDDQEILNILAAELRP